MQQVTKCGQVRSFLWTEANSKLILLQSQTVYSLIDTTAECNEHQVRSMPSEKSSQAGSLLTQINSDSIFLEQVCDKSYRMHIYGGITGTNTKREIHVQSDATNIPRSQLRSILLSIQTSYNWRIAIEISRITNKAIRMYTQTRQSLLFFKKITSATVSECHNPSYKVTTITIFWCVR